MREATAFTGPRDLYLLCATGSHHICPGVYPRERLVPYPSRWRCPCTCHHEETDHHD